MPPELIFMIFDESNVETILEAEKAINFFGNRYEKFIADRFSYPSSTTFNQFLKLPKNETCLYHRKRHPQNTASYSGKSRFSRRPPPPVNLNFISNPPDISFQMEYFNYLKDIFNKECKNKNYPTRMDFLMIRDRGGSYCIINIYFTRPSFYARIDISLNFDENSLLYFAPIFLYYDGLEYFTDYELSHILDNFLDNYESIEKGEYKFRKCVTG